MGFWEFGGGRVWGEGWNRGGQFASNLRPRWTDPVTARRVPSKLKGSKGEAKGSQQGEIEAREMGRV